MRVCWRFHNGSWSIQQVPMFNDNVACELAYCDYDTIAKGYGGAGVVIGPDTDIRAALHQVRQTAASGKPVLVNALIGKTSFRDGSLSV